MTPSTTSPNASGSYAIRFLGIVILAGVIGIVLIMRLNSPHDPTQKIDALLDEGMALCLKGSYADGLEKLNKAETWANRSKLHSYVAQANYMLAAFSYESLQSQYAPERIAAEKSGRVFHIPEHELTPVWTYVEKALGGEEIFPQAMRIKGLLYMEESRYANAITWLDKAIEENDRFAQAYNDKGLAYFHLKQYDRAKENFTRAIDIDENLSAAYLNLAILQATDANDETIPESYTDAAKNFRRFLNDGKGNQYEQELARTRLEFVSKKLTDLKKGTPE